MKSPRPALKFAGPFCVIEQSENLTVLEITNEGLGELSQLLKTSESLSSNLYSLHKILDAIRESKTQTN